jgi:SSS family transporter
MTAHLRRLDLLIVALYLITITIFGLRFREKKSTARQDRSLKHYFLADNAIPWWAIALSIVSAETSTLTIISVPGVAFAGDFGFLQIVLGYMVGRVVVALIFLPRYFAGQMLTAYQLIDQRFGPALHKVTAGLFLLTRAAAEGVRIFAVSIVVSIAIGTGNVLSIAIISALTLLYTFEGGMAAVIWTDVVQMAIYIGGTMVAVISLGAHVPGGWSTIHATAAAAGKFHMLHFALNLTQSYTFWAGLLGGTFLTMASHGTDQLMVQRMLAARNLRASQLALLSSGVIIFVQFALFLLIGVGLWVFYGLHAGTTFHSNDSIFPTFIVREMPVGVAGLLIAAILAAAMSNLSAALNSLASTTVVDFYMRLRPTADARERTLIAKSSTVLWALVLFAIAVYSLAVGGKGHVVEIGLSIASVAYGCLLGVFLLGTLTKFATEIGASIGMLCGFVLNVWLWQGSFPMRIGSITIPHIAFTWYVLIGAIVTFAIGALCSLIFRKQTKRTAAVVAMLCLVACCACSHAQTTAPDLSKVSTLINDAIAEHKLPGAVVIIGHDGRIVFEHAYGDRKLAGEPGLDGKPAPAEPMTDDTIFDMASLTKCLATTTAVMQLYEQGKIASFDDPVEKYLPAFNAQYDATRTRVTLRMLLTHTSGEAPDVDLKKPWGLAAPDRAEGLHRALTTPLQDAPGTKFVYSDINFILLGYLVEQLSGQREDAYVQQHVFAPLGMTETRYLPLDKACGPHRTIGAAIAWQPVVGRILVACPTGDWSTSLLERIAPTTHDDESKADPAANPHFDMLTRGTVHDPTARRMGGVAGHAGVFSTAHDVALFAEALLERVNRDTGNFPLKQATARLMIAPQQPATVEPATILTRDEQATAPALIATKGTPVRGFGWDINTAYSRPRGAVFPTIAPSEPAAATPSFGHTGFTGTSLWIDPSSDTYVVLLANAVHLRGGASISHLRGDVATAAGIAIGSDSTVQPTRTGIDVLEDTGFNALRGVRHVAVLTNQTGLDAQHHRTIDILANDLPKAIPGAKLTTIFTPEHGLSGTQDVASIASSTDAATGLPVISLYGTKKSDRTPTHAQLADLDAVVIDLQDAGVRFWTYEAASLYMLQAAAVERAQYHHSLQIIVLDRPNIVGGAAVQGPISDEGSESYVNSMPIPVRHGLTLGELLRYDNATLHLDVPLTVVAMQHWQRSETFADTGLPWVNPSPNLRSAEAALLYPALGLVETTNLSVGRGSVMPFTFFGAGTSSSGADRTHLHAETATAPEGTGGGYSVQLGGSGAPTVVDGAETHTAATRISRVRGEQGKPWFDADRVANALNDRRIPGVTFVAIRVPIADDANHYPYHGQTIPAVHVTLTDPAAVDTPELGIEIASMLHKLYPDQFHLEKMQTLLCNHAVLAAIARGEDPRAIAADWQPTLQTFRSQATLYLLYQP